MLAHELRNPLAALRVAGQLLSSSADDPEAVMRTSERMEWQIRSMARMVDDLLDVARITQGKITLRKERVDLIALLKRSLPPMIQLLEERGQTLTRSLSRQPLHVSADPVRLEQVVGNLIHNASKFTQEGGLVWLRARRSGSDEVQLQIRDNGRGIAPDFIDHVFDLFSQDQRSADRSHGGLGIGLTLVQKLVELHGGRIEVSSPGVGQGAQFSIFLPLYRESDSVGSGGGGRRPKDATAKTARRRRVLVVDDAVDTAKFQARLLQMAGHEVKVAYSGLDAVEMALAFAPEVILLDIGLPEMDGLEVARRMRQDPRTAGSTIIAITGYGMDEDRRRGKEAGIDHYLVKPADPRLVRELVESSGRQ
jgi:CheY-like chemotaxis protein